MRNVNSFAPESSGCWCTIIVCIWDRITVSTNRWLIATNCRRREISTVPATCAHSLARRRERVRKQIILRIALFSHFVWPIREPRGQHEMHFYFHCIVCGQDVSNAMQQNCAFGPGLQCHWTLCGHYEIVYARQTRRWHIFFWHIVTYHLFWAQVQIHVHYLNTHTTHTHTWMNEIREKYHKCHANLFQFTYIFRTHLIVISTFFFLLIFSSQFVCVAILPIILFTQQN